MKVITCTGYYSSGSSALSDLFAEYVNIGTQSDFEFRFLHDIDGISDLEFHLVECHNRHNSGHALKRFEKLCKFNLGNFASPKYSKFLEKNLYQQITKEYIEELIDFSYKGHWFYDAYDKGSVLYYLFSLFDHIATLTGIDYFCLLRNEITYGSHPSETEFLNATRTYVSKFLKALNHLNKEFLEVDQFVPSSNVERVLRYIEEETFVFIVDRDPRDIFLLNKYCYKDSIAPKDVDLFCKWYRYNREAGHGIPANHSHIKKIQFEDLIYKYEETVGKLEILLDLNPEKHEDIFKKFNPKRSIVNTRLWEKEKDKDAINRIETLLPEFLYNYDEVLNNKIVGVETDNKDYF